METQQATTTRANPRGYDTSFEAQNALMMMLSRRVHSRVRQSGAFILFEDIYQEACLAYTNALRTYDPSRGITFSAYLGRAVMNEANRYVKKRIEERTVHKVVAFCELQSDDNFSPEELIPDASFNVEDLSVRSAEIRERIDRLSLESKLIVRELLSPTRKVLAAHRRYVRAAVAKAAEKNARAPSTALTVRMIGKHLGFSRPQMHAIAREFKEVLGVTVNA
ncbi:sigma factor [Castellaniella sp.]|uniref:sigma factor n=1 Tax=Castellaniella sp. TaxID=1955812 RepID=UPI002B000EA0|nr:sigma factor [Castellaniella sp.]